MKVHFLLSKMLLMLTILVGATPRALSQSGNPYSFGSSCASQGLWTQRALQVTQEIINVAESLRDDENCSGIVNMVRGFQSKRGAFDDPGGDMGRQAQQWEKSPGDMSAIQTSIATDPSIRDEASGLMMQKVLDHLNLNLQITAGQISDLKARTKRTTSAALEMFDQVVQELPKFDQCLADKPGEGAILLSGIIQMAGVMASSQGDGMLTRVGRTVGTLLDTLRQRRFNKVIAELMRSQYWSSISCLLETTAENYCAVKDAYEIVSYSEQERALRREVEKSGFQNPLRGYYIMEREVEIVSTWVRRLQFGVDPRLKPIAVFKNSILDNFNGFWKDKNMLMATYNNARIQINNFPSLVGKQVHVYNLLKELVGELFSTHGSSWQQGSDVVNFFTTTINQSFLPFFLIGLKEIPEAARATEDNFSVKSWDEWMRTSGPNGAFVAAFDDPVALLDVIGVNLNYILDQAMINASNYFRNMFIVDLQSLTNETAVSQTLTVYKALLNINNYLTQLIDYIESRDRQDEHSLIILPTIYETKVRIEDVITAYEPLIELGRRYLNHSLDDIYQHIRITSNEVSSSHHFNPSVDEDPRKEAILRDMQNLFGQKGFEEIYKNIVDVFFGSFNILLQRDAFLYTRMRPIVHFDYTMRVKDGGEMSDYQRDLLIVSGKHLFDRLQGAIGYNIEDMKFDLSQAQVINRRNLRSLENLFSNELLPIILENKLVAEDRLSWEELEKEKNRHFQYTGCLNYAENNGDPLLYKGEVFEECLDYWDMNSVARGLLNMFGGDYWHEQTIPYRASRGRVARETNRYYRDLIKQGRGSVLDLGGIFGGRRPTEVGYATTMDDPYGSFARFKNKLCLQTLIFEDAKKFFYYCQDALITSYSPYEDETGAWESFLESTAPHKVQDSRGMPDYHRYVTFNEKNKSASYNGLFNRYYFAKDIEDKREWRDQNICALRSHLRRNYVYWLTQFQNENDMSL